MSAVYNYPFSFQCFSFSLSSLLFFFPFLFAGIGPALSVELPLPAVAQWLAAGLGEKLVACMATLQRRRAWASFPRGRGDVTPALLEAVLSMVQNVQLTTKDGDPDGRSGDAHAALTALRHQLCGGGAPWVAAVLDEAADQHAAGHNWRGLSQMATISYRLLVMRVDQPPADAATPSLPDAFAAALQQAASPAVLNLATGDAGAARALGMRAEQLLPLLYELLVLPPGR